MSTKELRLDLEATLIQAICGHGHAHYGYWADGPPDVPSMRALCGAQQAYFDLISKTIPEGTRTIFDVGSGTGANALGLTNLGYSLECLCPSKHLNDLAREKLPATVAVHDLMFEDYESDDRFDLCLFCESFHYIQLDTALAQVDRYAERHVLIFDYFRRDPNAGEDGTRGTHEEFLEKITTQGVFEIVSDTDMTQQILPTFDVLDYLQTELIGPMVLRARQSFAKSHPLRTRLVERLFGRKLDRIARRRNRAERFAETFEYRLILMARKDA